MKKALSISLIVLLLLPVLICAIAEETLDYNDGYNDGYGLHKAQQAWNDTYMRGYRDGEDDGELDEARDSGLGDIPLWMWIVGGAVLMIIYSMFFD